MCRSKPASGSLAGIVSRFALPQLLPDLYPDTGLGGDSYFRRCDGLFVNAFGEPHPTQRLAFQVAQQALQQRLLPQPPVRQVPPAQQKPAQQTPVQQTPGSGNQGRGSKTGVEVLPHSPPRKESQPATEADRPRQAQSCGSTASVGSRDTP